MNNVITINLNGTAYQLEEAAYKLLKKYLDEAAATLAGNPDKDEILTDLEQAIAEKCNKVLGPHKNVVVEKEVQQILAEMGSVGEEEHEEKKSEEKASGAPKRLYLIHEGAMIAGVCNGFAAFFNIDVTLMRIIFVILAILTHGAWILVYIVMMVVIPYATTGEEKAAAYGMPFNAQELVDRARASYEQYAKRDKAEWEKWGKNFSQHTQENVHRWQKQWEQQWKQNAPYAGQAVGTVGKVIVAVVTALLTIAWIYAVFLLITTGAILGYAITGIPLWLAVVILLALYNVVLLPLRSIERQYYNGSPYHHGQHGWYGMWDSIMWMGFLIIIGWLIYTYIPAAHSFIDQLPIWR